MSNGRDSKWQNETQRKVLQLFDRNVESFAAQIQKCKLEYRLKINICFEWGKSIRWSILFDRMAAYSKPRVPFSGNCPMIWLFDGVKFFIRSHGGGYQTLLARRVLDYGLENKSDSSRLSDREKLIAFTNKASPIWYHLIIASILLQGILRFHV